MSTLPFLATEDEPGTEMCWVLTLTGVGDDGVPHAATRSGVLRLRPGAHRVHVLAYLMENVGEFAGIPDGRRNVLHFSLEPDAI